ncbi:sugar ABC transporter ATP-binding protein [Mesorhizobium sp. BAC0120]|uniref:sugar ABC transporter ATP-binding protein n=1 Tax=Mesorhizobium sp. BAC0120 TaxID=3090670 RepID=UPI00298D429D|nr:sugar ABC transporter ATP-binding protein [Mesorhizobium sp. BAC0120]MDW6024024.1 sugar ABC transporter ATP-binding protein [Mesorhizobium sp. BAC0120]
MDLIIANSLSKRFGGIVALDRVEFSARAGEVHALLGENGAGKSTFIQILSGALRHDDGAILLDGQDYRPADPDAARARGIAAVFQELSLIPDLTVEQNIWFRQEPLTSFGTANRSEIRRRTLELFAKYHFPTLRPDLEVSRLSLAERQIVEIAKALAKQPRVLILDEATSALPAREAEWLLRLTRQLAAQGLLVIFISHRMAEVRAVADRLTIFRNGRTIAMHESSAVGDAEIVSQMIGRNLGRLYPERISTATGRVALKVSSFSSGNRLKNVEFDLLEGEVLGVGGLQGHGQRELFQALFGASKATGSIELWGKPAAISSPRAALTGRDGIALVPEDRRGQGLLLAKSVRENLTLAVIRRFTENGLLNGRKEAALVGEMVDFLRIKTRTPEQLAGTLSGGNQQKVIFGKMLLTEARVLLLYDPTRGVDVGTKGEIFQLMRDLAAKGYAILFHSSDMEELVHVADRVLVMRNGRVAATLAGERISEEGILSAAILESEAA